MMNIILLRLRLHMKLRSMGWVRYVTHRSLASKIEDVCTHTGQKWNSDDYRLVRFMNAPKVVNPNWAVHLIAEVPAKQVTQRIVWCDGGGGAEGHPRIYINLDKPGEHACGYCGLRYIKIDN